MQPDYVIRIVRRHYFYFIVGLTIALLSLLYQVYIMRDLPVVDVETKKEYLSTFIKYWDLHRRKLYWDYDTQAFRFLQPGVLLCIYSIIIAALGSIYFRAKESISFLFKLITVAGILSLCLGALSHFDPDAVPYFFHMFMPGRFINFSNITLAAVLLGILTVSDHRGLVLNYLVTLFFLSSIFFGMGVRDASYSVILPWFAFLTLRKHVRTHSPVEPPKRLRPTWLHTLLSREDFPAALGRPVGYGKILLCVISIFILVKIDDRAFVHSYIVHPSDFKDYTNDAFYRKISETKGVLTTTSDFFLISLMTRRPILLEPAALDALGMVPEAGAVWNEALVKVYGVDLFKPPPSCYQHRGIVFPILYRKLWETRSPKEWQEIGKEFGITGILTRPDWKLPLPVIARDKDKVLYEVVQ